MRMIRRGWSCLVFALAAFPALSAVPTEGLLADYVARFNRDDVESVTNAIPNSAAAEFMRRNCPRFSCPDAEIERTYYFRWWTFRKHLSRSPAGWVVTEFMPDVSWAGKYNTISCPFGHHFREGRWLRSPTYLDDYMRIMLREGLINGPKAYLCWPAWATLERAKVTGDFDFAKSLLPDFLRNYEAWERGWTVKGLSLKDVKTADNGKGPQIRTGFRAERGLFDFAGDREGSEFALSADGARPMVNAALWAEATAIARIAAEAGEADVSARYAAKAAALDRAIKERLWNAGQKFFTSLSVEGVQDDVRELHGYAPFYFGMDLKGFGEAWAPLMSERGFFAPIGLTFPARSTPGFDLSVDLKRHECLWNGPSWPYATSIALTALSRTLQSGLEAPVTAEDFAKLMKQYAAQQVMKRPDGRTVPWIDENLDPFTGEWIARRHMIAWDREGIRKLRYRERGKDYNHSTFCDLVISGLVGIVPKGADGFDVDPLCPRTWDRFVLENLRCCGHEVAVRWMRGQGLEVRVDGEVAARRADLGVLNVRFGK